jgi:hypothetical protein
VATSATLRLPPQAARTEGPPEGAAALDLPDQEPGDGYDQLAARGNDSQRQRAGMLGLRPQEAAGVGACVVAVARQQADRAAEVELELRRHQQRRAGLLEANAHLGPAYRQVVRELAWQRRAAGLATEHDPPGYLRQELGPVPVSTRAGGPGARPPRPSRATAVPMGSATPSRRSARWQPAQPRLHPTAATSTPAWPGAGRRLAAPGGQPCPGPTPPARPRPGPRLVVLRRGAAGRVHAGPQHSRPT